RQSFKGKCVTVDDRGFRATWNQPDGGADDLRRNVWLFGGSSMWGSGARDDYTIASSLSKLLAESFPGVFRVTNMGETGYVSTQEVITLLKEIQRGESPHVVIFYNGVNDTFAILQSARRGVPQNEWNRIREFNLLNPSRSADLYAEALRRTNTYALIEGIQRKVSPARGPARPATDLAGDRQALVAGLVNVYLANLDAVAGLAARRNFRYRFYWQPSLFTKRVKSGSEEEREATMTGIRDAFGVVNAGLQAAGALARHPDIRDVSDLFGSHAGTVFTDWVHTTEHGNAMIARRIFEDSRALFVQAAAEPRP
ncbi:MAG: SGNH/GDSL hydrolase family protein, partial [Gemmatimonadales bacterium]